MNQNDDKALWDLLGKTRYTSPSPMFTQNVLRAIRIEEAKQAERPSLWKNGLAFLTGSMPRRFATSMAVVVAAFLCYSAFDSASVSGINSLVTHNSQNYSQELASVEVTAQALQGEAGDNTLIEMASCYTDDLSDDEMSYLLANL